MAESKKELVDRAKKELCVNALEQHCDDNFLIGGSTLEKKVDDIIKTGQVDEYYIHLSPTSKPDNKITTSLYRRIDG